MFLRKTITILKFIEFFFCGVKLKKTIHTNIEKGVKIYNSGKKLEIGETYIRANSNINTEGKGELIIGSKVFINRNAIISCRNKITIEDNCIIGPNVCIYDHDHKFGESGVENGYILEDVIIEKNCWIGAGVIILKGTHLGENCVVAAGTILKGNYPANSMIYNKKETVVKRLVAENKEEKSKVEEE